MNNSGIKNSGNVLNMFVLDTPAPGLVGRRGGPRQAPTNPFGVEFRECFDKSAMAQQDFAEVLSLELKRPVSQVNVSNWLHGVEPRTTLTHPNLANDILAAAQRIAANEADAGREKYADTKKVAAQLAEWETAGLTAKQVQLAAEISVTLYRAWLSGKVRISAVRWEMAQTKVNMWKDFVTEHQRQWQASQAEAKEARAPGRSSKARKA